LFVGAALVFSNLECCLYQCPSAHSFHNEGFFADPVIGGAALRQAGIAAVDVGADLVIGHGPHYSLAVEVYKGRAIVYGLGSFCFHTGHGGRRQGDWIGLMPSATIGSGGVECVRFHFVRHNDRNGTVPRVLADEASELTDLVARNATWGTRFTRRGDEVEIEGI
jgi:poly-gamma-glutamate synthesis protein (capsule biosynthesis protein)